MKKIFTLCLFAFFSVTMLNAQAPTITSFTPLTAKPGDAVTLTGTGFKHHSSQIILYFCGTTKANVTAATATSVTITVPSGATHETITLLKHWHRFY